MEGDIVFDIGANVGYFTLSLSKLTGENGQVFSFEAIPNTAKILSKNCELNNLKNVRLFEHAVSNKNGTSIFLIPEKGENHTMASMVWHKDDSSVEKVLVDTIAIDQHPELSTLSPSFIKIDVEGAEAFVLAGMKELLKRSYPKIFIECSSAGRKESWELLTDIGYSCYKASIPLERLTNFNHYKHNDFLWVK